MISNIKATEGLGDSVLKKKIHEGSESIMFGVLQESQYMYPFKSSVREIVSNCLDSITERNNSIKIIKGELKVEDLYIVKEGTEFSGSSFNAEYYDLNWLSTNNMVTILYIDNDTPTRDRIKFIDNGVGLGGKRLINYFSLGYSSKRLSKNQLGSFGLGAKSLLATGVDFYTVTSRYNGREYSFNVFKDHVVAAISKFNDDGTINDLEVFFEGTEDEYSAYYRTTKELNGVTIEAEVKRHRKADYISSIENQLGFIENIELLIADGDMDYTDPVKRTIATEVLFSSPEILVGKSDYYAVPQILLKPGEDSNIKISYGTINFEELEMKKYTGNVSFIMNINEVDVTPSRENVIWNTKTREAIKRMFTTAQNTVSNIIEEKLSDEKTLPDYLTLLSTFKNKESIQGLAELYKIIDTTNISNTFRGFSISKAALELDESAKKDLIFTSTNNLNSYGTAKFTDTTYASALSNEYISKLSTKNASKNVFLYVGGAKYKNLARYIANEFSYSDKNLDIIYIKDELYGQVVAEIGDAGGLDKFLDNAYKKKNYLSVLLGEVVRFSTNPATKSRVFFHDDIDVGKMNNMEKIEEEKAESNRYMSWREKEKASGKVIGNVHSSVMNVYREYLDEYTIGRDAIIYQLGDPFIEAIFRASNSTYLPSNTRLIGFSQDNFKRFYKLPGVRTLTNCLYTIEFGDLAFTKLGEVFLSSSDKSNISNLYNKDPHNKFLHTSVFSYLEDTYKDFKVDLITFDRAVSDKKKSVTKNYIKYLEEEEPCTCDKCKTL